MHFATIASLVLTFSTAVSADCYKGGATRTQADVEQITGNNYSALRYVCMAMTNGSFRKGQETQSCLAAWDSNQKWNFRIQRTGGSADLMSLSLNDCITGLATEAVACQHGGSETHGDWKYTADINAGTHC